MGFYNQQRPHCLESNIAKHNHAHDHDHSLTGKGHQLVPEAVCDFPGAIVEQ